MQWLAAMDATAREDVIGLAAMLVVLTIALVAALVYYRREIRRTEGPA